MNSTIHKSKALHNEITYRLYDGPVYFSVNNERSFLKYILEKSKQNVGNVC